VKTCRARSTLRLAAVVVAALMAASALAVVYVFDPCTSGVYPLCAFHELTGLQCPGCGGLRAMHHLAHGHIAAAWNFNPFVVALLPVALWLGLREAVRAFTGRQWPGLVTRPVFGWLLVGALLAFGILRNVPFHPGQ
jgi:hypothetical protein